MAETLIDCLDKKARVKYVEMNTIMSEALREDVIKDTGHQKLKLKELKYYISDFNGHNMNPEKYNNLITPGYTELKKEFSTEDHD